MSDEGANIHERRVGQTLRHPRQARRGQRLVPPAFRGEGQVDVVRLLVAAPDAEAKSRSRDPHRHHIPAGHSDLLLGPPGHVDAHAQQIGEPRRDALHQPEQQETGPEHHPNRPPVLLQGTAGRMIHHRPVILRF